MDIETMLRNQRRGEKLESSDRTVLGLHLLGIPADRQALRAAGLGEEEAVQEYFVTWQQRGWVTYAKSAPKTQDRSARARRKYVLSRSARLALFGKCREVWHVQSRPDYSAARAVGVATFRGSALAVHSTALPD